MTTLLSFVKYFILYIQLQNLSGTTDTIYFSIFMYHIKNQYLYCINFFNFSKKDQLMYLKSFSSIT